MKMNGGSGGGSISLRHDAHFEFNGALARSRSAACPYGCSTGSFACRCGVPDASVDDMVRGLVRAAEIRERDDGGKVWDDEVRVALDAARAMGWGKNRVGHLSAESAREEERQRHATVRLTVVAVVVVIVTLALALSGCGAPASALKACEVYLRVNRAHVDDASLPPEARSIALDNADAWEVMREDLGGPPTSAATRKRLAR
jgi:hypothetical protein